MSYSVILFDGVCNLCNGTVNFVIDHDPKLKFRFAALQSEVGQSYVNKFGLDTQKFDSVLLVENDKIYTKSTAALRIAKNLSGVWSLFYYVFGWLPAFFRDIFYDLIAKNRYKMFGKTDACRMPTTELQQRFL